MLDYTVDEKKNRTTGKWIIRRPDDLRLAYADTRDEAQAIARDLNELQRLRVILAWQCGQLAESQACAILGAKAEDLARWRDTCLGRLGR